MIRNTAGTILLAATVTAAALTQATYVRAAGKLTAPGASSSIPEAAHATPPIGSAVRSSTARSSIMAAGSISPGGCGRTEQPRCGFRAARPLRSRPAI